jgi:DNA-directed RNA polymerase subunit RPC12/RpoP
MFKKYSSMLAHLETDACTTTRVKLDLLAIECPYSKDYVRPGSEKHLRNGGRNMYYPKPVIHRGLPRRFRCSKCDVEFPTYGAMHRHLRLTVHHPLVYQCAGCEMQFADLSALVSHAESLACEEGLSKGTGSIAQLLRYLWLRLEK